ncbi:phosphomethylpyrimidine ki [Basidiobolus meristosporus CBS 931.73]|uniref:Phosphomethylpyrimidine ki n=1 Tax=Basidiobolus meristosporus CBS 931.73 TaxID=1314790 RepID=A0A1Y1YF99_9FUNG|nr:phosphomethylpyrimidine ki [Basidiobolus meristosporus CBS 931.73]|eukprot:ORX96720.1 phosphomethylpyrimidine ki [Basidiobolus meristosporus CBS 931.73]
MTVLLEDCYAEPPKVLTIAGSDSGGGAGIQADLKTFTALQVYGTSVITSVTSQNTVAVDGIQALPSEFVGQQLNAVLSDIGAEAVKTGMLFNSEIIEAVTKILGEFALSKELKLVVDPVMVSASGSTLVNPKAVHAMKHTLTPMAQILTPNIHEAELLLCTENEPRVTNTIQTLEDMISAAKELTALGPRIVLVKGGSIAFDKNMKKVDIDSTSEPLFVVDIFYDKESNELVEFKREFIRTKNNHGTGCTLSAAIAAGLGKGLTAKEAVAKGIEYVHSAIQTSFTVGHGHGPLNHFHGLVKLPLPHPSTLEPHPLSNYLIGSNPELWHEYTHHPFVQQMADGTLPRESFIHYIKQDYIYLQHYARANALASYKASTMSEIAAAAQIVVHIATESQLHVKYCEQWGITYEDILNTEESMQNVAYTRYVLDKGHSGGPLDLQVALAPCLLGYGVIGKRLFNDPNTKRGMSGHSLG